jgi:hypothetical protein
MKPHVPGRTVRVLLVVAVVLSTAAVGMAVQPTRPVSRQVDATPDIAVQPETLRFSNTTGESDARTLTVRNVGDGPLTIDAVGIVGPDRASFERAFDGPVTLGPDDRQNVTVTFDAATARPQFATLHILSNDPDEPQRNVWLTNTRTVADVSPSRVLERKTLVNATITDAEANTTQSLNISWPLTRDDVVAVDALSFTPARAGAVTLSVATNVSRFDDVPVFALDDGTEPAGYVHVDHSIANERVSNVTFRIRVRKDRLVGNETGPEDVALYRHEASGWVELPTRFVEEGETHYFFEARAPGLSDFTTGVKQAKFRITDALVTVTRISTHQGTEVRVRVRNVGGADGTYTVKLLLEETMVDRTELSIAPNGTRQTTFERSFDEPGTYQVYVNERFVGNVTVETGATVTTGASTPGRTGLSPAETTGGTPTERREAGGITSGESVPGLGVGTTVVALLVVALSVAARRRHR